MTISNDLAAARSALKAWLAAFDRRDLNTLMSLYDKDSVYANAASPIMRGPGEIKPWFAGAFESIEGHMRFKEEASFIQGETALLVGKYFIQNDGAEPAPGSTGRVGLMFRRDSSGAWKILFDMDNTPPDVSPADFA
ncbi:ketosteroid isomerase-like protein [Roseibium hamelinense]|uniref:Ketosteroid isomerase-like protein n=1 Tax=Roseibium hamelinense TaxID=150831 RepID=A0A562SF68_9HYPH|nr:nuclear transport factor 2 family protein [Roseibium hamelinense]MTI44215.1 DUF4440 domain-containing protein [Roseibium hamelinense]TWI80001.1 ketosteroid isomerase-like protein [Roseibium hamelinense]